MTDFRRVTKAQLIERLDDYSDRIDEERRLRRSAENRLIESKKEFEVMIDDEVSKRLLRVRQAISTIAAVKYPQAELDSSQSVDTNYWYRQPVINAEPPAEVAEGLLILKHLHELTF